MAIAHITLHRLELDISLGVSDAERAIPQTLWLDIDIQFQTPPRACKTDQLKETYCYDTLTQKIAEQIKPRSFHLLEHVGYEIYQLVKNSYTQPLTVLVKVTKKPLLSSNLVIANASFSYGDS